MIFHYRVVDAEGVPAQPGDLLMVELCNLGPLRGDEWGFTGTFDRDNGGGFLTDHFPYATKAIWHFDGIYTSSRHIPGVRFAGGWVEGREAAVPLAASLSISRLLEPLKAAEPHYHKP
jgi:formamidase